MHTESGNDHVIDGFYRWTDIKFAWPSVLEPLAASLVKSLTSLEALAHPEHPLREQGADGITFYIGVLPGKKGPRLLFSLQQIEYLSYWISATGFLNESSGDAEDDTVPIPSLGSLILPHNLIEIHPVEISNVEQLKLASKKPQAALRAIFDGTFDDICDGPVQIASAAVQIEKMSQIAPAFKTGTEASIVNPPSSPDLPRSSPQATLWHVREAYAMASMAPPETDDQGRKIGKAAFVTFLVEKDDEGAVSSVGWAAVYWRDGSLQTKQGHLTTTSPNKGQASTYLFGEVKQVSHQEVSKLVKKLLRDLLIEVDADGAAVIYLVHHSAHQPFDTLSAIGIPSQDIRSDLVGAGLPTYLDADANGQVFAIDTSAMLAAESEAKEATSKLFLRDFAQQVGCMVAGDAVWGHPGNEVFVLLQSFMLLASLDPEDAMLNAKATESTTPVPQKKPWWDQDLDDEDEITLDELDIGIGGPEDSDDD